MLNMETRYIEFLNKIIADGRIHDRAAVVYLIFRAGSTFPVPVFTVSPGHWVSKADSQ